jgi:hypothetical protein
MKEKVMGFFDRLLGKKPAAEPDPDAPFMEHPTGQFKSAVEAMADAIKRLRALSEWNEWITFCAQGKGHDENSEHHAEIRMRQNEIQVDEALDMAVIAGLANVEPTSMVAVGANYSLAAASPEEAARILDAIFRHQLGIRPFPDQGNDYAIGAEW